MGLQEIVYRGTLVSTGAPLWIPINAGFDEFHLRNRTTFAAGAGIVESVWYTGMPNGWAITDTVAAGTITRTVIAAAGFTYGDTSIDTLGPAIAVTAVTNATPAVAATATTPVVGDIVRIYGTTAMLQIAGMDFSITAVAAGVNMTFGFLPAAGFAAAATAGTYRRLPHDLTCYPRNRYITAMTAAASSVITLSVAHDYVVGSYITLVIPASFGTMSAFNGRTARVTAINAATNTITVDLNTVGFAFAFPTSAIAAAGTSFAQVLPAGEVATILTSATRDPGFRGIYLGTAIDGTAADIFDYWAIRSAT